MIQAVVTVPVFTKQDLKAVVIPTQAVVKRNMSLTRSVDDLLSLIKNGSSIGRRFVVALDFGLAAKAYQKQTLYIAFENHHHQKIS